MKKLALFDMDGTLFDTEKVNYYAYKQAIEEQGYSLDYETYQKYCIGRQFKDFIPNIIPDRKDLYSIIHARKKEVYPNYLEHARLNKHLINIAKNLKESYILAIVTTASKKNVDDILNKFKITDLFDFIITGEDVSKNKPDPECYFKAINKVKISEEDVIIFEDSKPGIEAARKTGATIIVIDRF